MSENNKFALSLIAINKNEQIKKLKSFGDKAADLVTAIAGSTAFLVLNIVWFVVWILINTGFFGKSQIFDEYPFGFLTMVVSLEAIILSVFVLISQNLQSNRSELRAELDYVTDLQADAEIAAIITILQRLSAKQGMDITDVLETLEVKQKKILKDHPVTESALDNLP